MPRETTRCWTEPRDEVTMLWLNPILIAMHCLTNHCSQATGQPVAAFSAKKIRKVRIHPLMIELKTKDLTAAPVPTHRFVRQDFGKNRTSTPSPRRNPNLAGLALNGSADADSKEVVESLHPALITQSMASSATAG